LASINQNAGEGQNTGFEWVFAQQLGSKVKLNANANIYWNVIGEFTIVNAYPSNISLSKDEQSMWAGNVKSNLTFKLPKKFDFQFTATYLAPDIVPQGKILARYYFDAGITREIQKGKGELFLNLSDIFNTHKVRYELEGNDFSLVSDDYFESQVVRFGYQYRF